MNDIIRCASPPRADSELENIIMANHAENNSDDEAREEAQRALQESMNRRQ